MTTDIEDDLEADLRAALNPAEPEAVEAAPEPVEAIPVETTAEGAEKPSGERERGPDGKFVAKSTEMAQDTTEQPAKVETPSESIRPPASWTPAAKAKFATLDPEVQKEVLRREQDVEKGFRDRAEQLKRYEPLENILAPRRALWAAQGLDEASAIKTLLAAQDLLEQDPRKGLEFLAKSYGVDLAQPVQGQAFAPQPAGNSPTPEFTALQQELADLKRQMATQSEAGLVSQIEAFRQDPKNLYFENVREDMAVLLNSGKAKDLPEAYEMACWMNPEIRALLQTPQVAPVPAQDVSRKKAAGSSVTGSPAQAVGAVPNPNGSIEDDIRAAILEAQGR